jgi:hypothetical protein
VRAAWAFAALRTRNYQLCFCGQLVWMSGWSMQTLGQSWLVFKLTGSGVDLGGVVTALPFMAERVLHSGASGYGAMVAIFGIGALGGAYFAASDPHQTDVGCALWPSSPVLSLLSRLPCRQLRRALENRASQTLQYCLSLGNFGFFVIKTLLGGQLAVTMIALASAVARQ